METRPNKTHKKEKTQRSANGFESFSKESLSLEDLTYILSTSTSFDTLGWTYKYFGVEEKYCAAYGQEYQRIVLFEVENQKVIRAIE